MSFLSSWKSEMLELDTEVSPIISSVQVDD